MSSHAVTDAATKLILLCCTRWEHIFI